MPDEYLSDGPFADSFLLNERLFGPDLRKVLSEFEEKNHTRIITIVSNGTRKDNVHCEKDISAVIASLLPDVPHPMQRNTKPQYTIYADVQNGVYPYLRLESTGVMYRCKEFSTSKHMDL